MKRGPVFWLRSMVADQLLFWAVCADPGPRRAKIVAALVHFDEDQA